MEVKCEECKNCKLYQRYQKQLEYNREYNKTNKKYLHEWYENHKDDPDYKRRVRISNREYYKRKTGKVV